MPAMGEVHVRASSGSAGAAARWLRSELLPRIRAQRDTVLTPGHNAETARDLEQLAAKLAKAAAKKRPADSATFTINVQRRLVERFISATNDRPLVLPDRVIRTEQRRPLPRSVAEMLEAMRVAAQSRRGAPRDAARREVYLRAVPADTAWSGAPGEARKRHLRRIRREERSGRAWAEWAAEVNRRGETVLTTTVLPPKV